MKHLKFMAVAMAAVVLIGSCKQKSETPVEQNNDNIYQFTVLDGTDNLMLTGALETILTTPDELRAFFAPC